MNNNNSLQLKYSCIECGLKDAVVNIPTRNPEEDVVAWFNKVMETYVFINHQTLNPRCKTKALKNVMIPISTSDKEAEYIGGPINKEKEG